ncbi:hypothetical protein L8S13_20445 [Vibrio lentus]|uniref:hypothetical protein n=1 Tax=Vibrio lentus TaxID=136468 RepID=UPI0024692077|nr:hypothetical protein [Vibrio lentus]MDH5928672.1 hypothetical protein [Vibrio lentus]
MKIPTLQSHNPLDGNSSPKKSTFNVRKISNVPKSIFRAITVFFGLRSNQKRSNAPKSHTSNTKVASQPPSGNNLSTTSPSVNADAPKDKTDLQPPSGNNLSTTSPSVNADAPKDKTDLQPTSGDSLSNRASAQSRLNQNPKFKALQSRISSDLTSNNSLLNKEQKNALDVKNREEKKEERLQKQKNEDENRALTSNDEPMPNPNPNVNVKPGQIPPPPPPPPKKSFSGERKEWAKVQVDDSFSKNNNKTKGILTPQDKTQHATILSLNEAMTNSSLFKAQKEGNNQEN